MRDQTPYPDSHPQSRPYVDDFYGRPFLTDPRHKYTHSPTNSAAETVWEIGSLVKNGVVISSSLYQGKRRRLAPKTPPRAPPAIRPEAMITPRSIMLRPSSPPTRFAR